MVWPFVRSKAAGSGFSYHLMLKSSEVLVQSDSCKQNSGTFEGVQPVDFDLKRMYLYET